MANVSAIARLLEAAGSGRLEEVKKLVSENPSLLNATGTMGITVGHVAAFYGRCAVLRFLAAEDTNLLYARTPDGGTLAHSAAANGCCEALQFLAEVNIGLILGVDSDEWTAAHSAAYYNQRNALTFLTKSSSWLISRKNSDGLVPEDFVRRWAVKAQAEAKAAADAKANMASTSGVQREKSGVQREKSANTGRDQMESSKRTEWGCADAQIDIATAEQEGKWKALLKGLRKGSDITSMLIPVDFIRPESSLERVQDIMQRPRLLEEIVRPGLSDLERMLAVVRFQISTIIKAVFDGKKPYNPVLGETCAWAWVHPEGQGVSRMVTEQVSHHPPISAVHLSNATLGLTLHGTAEISPKFTGNSVVVPFKGNRTLTLHSTGEQYVMTYLPNLQYRGLLMGSRGAEWTGKVSIRCEQTQLEAKLHFKALGMLGMWGVWHKVEGAILHAPRAPRSKRTAQPNKDAVLAGTISGRWAQRVTFMPASAPHADAGEAQTLYDFDEAAGLCSLSVAPTPAAVLPTDSQMVWERLTKALKEGDLKTAAQEKRAVEQRQRAIAAARKQKGAPFQASFFRLAPSSPHPTSSANSKQSSSSKDLKSQQGMRWVPDEEAIARFHAERMQVEESGR